MNRNVASNKSCNRNEHNSANKETESEPFAQVFRNFTVREFSNNTRMNIRNVDHKQANEKRQRMINYWQSKVV